LGKPRCFDAAYREEVLLKRTYLLSASFVFVQAASDVCSAAETISVTIKSLSFDPKQVEAHVG
jgi:hypothetical protein